MFEYEKEFIDKLVQQDKDAFNEFYLDSVDIFYRYLSSNYFFKTKEIEDVLSEFYFKFWNVLDKYDPKGNFSAWVWMIFKNLIRDVLRKKKDVQFSTLTKGQDYEFEDRLEANNTSVKEQLKKDYKYERIKKHLNKLDKVSQDIIYFQYIEKRSLKEISNILSLSYSNVRKKSSRAIKKLKKRLNS